MACHDSLSKLTYNPTYRRWRTERGNLSVEREITRNPKRQILKHRGYSLMMQLIDRLGRTKFPPWCSLSNLTSLFKPLKKTVLSQMSDRTPSERRSRLVIDSPYGNQALARS